MTDPIVTIEPAELSVEPGGQARVEVTVRNPSSIVESYRIEVLADTPGDGPAAWAEVHPSELRVYPKEKANAIIVFAPPAGLAATSGRFAFGVRAVSTVPPAEAAAVAEGDLEIGRVFGLQATITPMTSSGRWRGNHLLQYTNWGNSPVHLHLTARDPDDRLGFLLEPTDVELPLGATATARLSVRTRKPFLRGTPTRLPFEVTGEQDQPGYPPPSASQPGDPRRPVLSGGLMQRPILSRGTVALAGLAVAALAGALVLALKTPKTADPIVTSGLPDPPASVQATAQSASSITVSWPLVANAQSYQVITRRGNTNIDFANVKAPTQQLVTKGLMPSTLYCFEVVSMRGKQASAATRPVCQRTGAATPSSGSSPASSSSASSSGGAGAGPGGAGGPGASSSPASSGSGTAAPPQFKPGQILVLIDAYPDDMPNAKKDAFAKFGQLLGDPNGHVDGILQTSEYPNLLLLGQKPVIPFWLLYVGPFEDTSTANMNCQQLAIQNCRKVYPEGP